VLEVDANNVKVLVRRGTAYARLNDNEKALVDLDKALTLDPKNASAKLELQKIKRLEKEQEAAMRAKFVNMFASGAAKSNDS